jgi:polar amino acid transport system substrate-binding protein
MSALLRVALLALLASAWTATSRAADSPFRDIQRILKNKRLVVAILARDVAPMIITDKAGQPTGFEIELAKDIGKKLGVAVKFVRTAETYDAVVDVVARGQADIAVSFLSRSVERAKKVYFSDPYIKQGALLIYNRVGWAKLREKFPRLDKIWQIPNTEAVATVEFAVLKGSVYATRVAREFPQVRTRTYDSFAEIMAAVKSGEVLAAYHGEIQIQYYMRQHPETAIYVGIDPLVLSHGDIGLAVRPDAPNLLRWLNIYLANHVGTLDAKGVLQRYTELQAEKPPEKNQIDKK